MSKSYRNANFAILQICVGAADQFCSIVDNRRASPGQFLLQLGSPGLFLITVEFTRAVFITVELTRAVFNYS